MKRIKHNEPRGILHAQAGKKKFNETRILPSLEIGCFVEHFWFVEWNLPAGEPYIVETLPHPCIHIVFENTTSYVLGIMKKKFKRKLEGTGSVFGIKFHPGGFYPFLSKPLTALTNKQFSLHQFFGKAGKKFNQEIFSLQAPESKAIAAEKFLLSCLPNKDETVVLIQKIAERIITDTSILKVEDVASAFSLSQRTLQRIFSTYVGISPKWMIKRYRLHEAIDVLEKTSTTNLAAIAHQLGYYDQAHFIKDFKSIIGVSPLKYIHSSQTR